MSAPTDTAPIGGAFSGDLGLIATGLAAGGVCSAVEAMALPYADALAHNVRLQHRYAEEQKAHEDAMREHR